MSDDLKKRAPQDRARINIHEEHELRYWSQKFGVSPDELRRVVADVGVSADAVARKLQKQ